MIYLRSLDPLTNKKPNINMLNFCLHINCNTLVNRVLIISNFIINDYFVQNKNIFLSKYATFFIKYSIIAII